MQRIHHIIKLDRYLTSRILDFIFLLYNRNKIQSNIENGIEQESTEVKYGVIEAETGDTFTTKIGDVLGPKRNGPGEKVSPTKDYVQ